jgi:hypothetical protein
MVALIAHVARTARPNSGITELHQAVLRELSTTYVTGSGVFRGGFDNWSFRPKSRAAARMPFIVQIQPRVGRPQLAPTQYVRLRNDVLRAINTLYLDIDMTRIYRVDDSEKSFYAEFYLSMRDDAASAGIEQIEFANAFLDPRTNDRQVTVRTLNKGGRSDAYPDNMMIYQVSGKFMFDPDLGNYPFDQQRFSIDIRPKSGDAPFIVQPPPDTLRDRALATDGWDSKIQYVGYDEDFVQTIDARSYEHSIVPFYRASFVWTMSRETTDYYLRVVVPLAFILIVAYLSIFIPQTHFEAIVTIQVTALLSAVALYIALPQIDADSTTLSDRIFVFTYMAVSLMIGLSILRMNEAVAARPRLQMVLGVVHVAVIPIMVAAMALYIHRISTAAL